MIGWKYLLLKVYKQMRMKQLFIVVMAWIPVLLISCGERKSSEKKLDSLFLGVSMGMEKKAFYDYCWEMNRQKVFKHGPANQSVEYRLATELKSPVMMQFYPSFFENKIYEMPVLFSYESWAPWNKEYGSDVLLTDLLTLFKKWYGDDFQTLQHRTQGTIYYQMKGRRRINLFIRDDQFVQAVFTDLKVDEEIKNKK